MICENSLDIPQTKVQYIAFNISSCPDPVSGSGQLTKYSDLVGLVYDRCYSLDL